MSDHDQLISDLLDEADRLLTRVDDLRLYLLATSTLSRQDPKKWHFATMEARGSSIVSSIAELESLTRFLIQATHKELNNRHHPIKDMRACLRPLAAHATFESLRQLSDSSKLWSSRARTTNLDGSSERLDLPIAVKSAQPPLDGKTLRPEHFLRLWSIYGLPGVAFPTVSWEGTLRKLAGARNDLAHGNLPFGEIFQAAGMSVVDVDRYLLDIADFALHLVDSWTKYLERRGYLAAK